ncbi:hypothetical protein RHGRI_009671 [Rhododendron griersonianum]|uniref:Transmembrane protein n=1 Tax=Rhododendron griersonianum TaxID=479676 RepID=A0AAV6KFM6_9ERIC|nr:hypothetical protein RHGRI_009671 [Rhododendron griersonianum]
MAKAVALIAFALGLLAIAGNVQGYTFIKAEDVDPTNKPMIQSIDEVVCATCKLNFKTDFEVLKTHVIAGIRLPLLLRTLRQLGRASFFMNPTYFSTYVDGGVVLKIDQVDPCISKSGHFHIASRVRTGDDPHHA